MTTIILNGEARRFEDRVSVAEIVAGMVERTNGVAVAVNGEVVARNKWSATLLSDADRVEILSAVQGG